MKVESPEYEISYDEVANLVCFKGVLRLNAAQEYAPISGLLDDVLKRNAGGEVNWDVSELVFLNSSGINMLYQFVLKVRKQANVRMGVRGSTAVPWQQKSLSNMTRFMPSLKLELS